MRRSEEFLVLISKVERPEDQEAVIGECMESQFNRGEGACITSLLAAMKDKKFHNEALEVVAIKEHSQKDFNIIMNMHSNKLLLIQRSHPKSMPMH